MAVARYDVVAVVDAVGAHDQNEERAEKIHKYHLSDKKKRPVDDAKSSDFQQNQDEGEIESKVHHEKKTSHHDEKDTGA